MDLKILTDLINSVIVAACEVPKNESGEGGGFSCCRYNVCVLLRREPDLLRCEPHGGSRRRGRQHRNGRNDWRTYHGQHSRLDADSDRYWWQLYGARTIERKQFRNF